METKRLILRTLSLKDARDIFESIHHDKKVLEYFLARYYDDYDDFDFESLLRYFRNSRSFYYGIELKENHQCIGMIFENARNKNKIEIGYAISSKKWNQGYASEALKAVLEELLQKEDLVVSAAAISENKASIRVMEKCGMKFSHVVKNEIEWNGKIHDVVYYVKEKENV